MLQAIAKEEAALIATPPPSVGAQAARILVVDDERTNLAIVSRLLERHGYRTVRAAGGHEALQAILNSHVDLVMLDIVMPEMDGFEVLKRIRCLRGEADLPVIMVTGNHEKQQTIQAFRNRANDYVTKPFDAEVIIARIDIQLRLKRAQLALQESEERYALAARGTNDGLWDWNMTSNRIYYSPRWREMLGLDPDDAKDDPEFWFQLIHEEDRKRVSADLRVHCRGESEQFETELRMRHSNGTYRWMLCRGVAVRGGDGAAHRIAGSLTDITAGKMADGLTGLPNRLMFTDRVQRCIERVRRYPGRRFAVLYLDLDNFKLVNDSLGHNAGDQLLVSVARRLETITRSCESVIARLGGDEFIVLLEDIDDPWQAERIADRLVESFTQPFMLDGRELFTQASIGLSIGSDESRSVDDVVREADSAMFQSKASGKGAYRIYNPDMQAQASARLEIEGDLRRAVERNEFVLHYQPIVDLASGAIAGFEALVRWNHPRLGQVSPLNFIPIAEETGQIVSLGRWVLQEACRQVAGWHQEFPQYAGLTIAINVSARQLLEPTYLQDFGRILSQTGIAPSTVKLELTESTLVKDPDHASELLQGLRAMQIHVAIDDFGTGYSSLTSLHRLPLDGLKIDRSFVSRMHESETNVAIVKSILSLASNLHLDVVAEGIETTAQRDCLKQLGCQHGQGYLFARPLPAAEAAKLLAQAKFPA